MFFENRTDAGQKLAVKFQETQRDFTGFSVIGIARGGVIIAAEVARALGLPLQSMSVDDVAAFDGVLTATSLNSGILSYPGRKNKRSIFIPHLNAAVDAETARFVAALLQKHKRFNVERIPTVPTRVILCDDGLVSGNSAFTAIAALRHAGVAEIVLGIPVVLPWVMEMKRDFDIVTWRVSKMKNPATGIFYFSFEDTPDEDVVAVIRDSQQRHATAA